MHIMNDNNQYNLTWQQFEHNHPDENSRRTEFENLCRAIFQKKFCKDKTILHSNPNHPGVEIEPIYSEIENAYISFQAKYFNNKVDYKQIEKSADITVLNYNSDQAKLEKLFLFCNKDINTTSKLYCNIKNKLMQTNIELIPFTGQSILDEVSSYPMLLLSYFGVQKLDIKWIKDNIELSLKRLGKRYNKKFNIYNRSEELFSIFIQNKLCISVLNKRKNNIISELVKTVDTLPCDEKIYIQPLISKIEGINDITENSISDALHWDQTFLDNIPKDLDHHIQILQDKYKSITKIQSEENTRWLYERELCSNTIYKLNSIQRTFFLSTFEKDLITSQILILTGEVGIGKTQTLAHVAYELFCEQKFVILILGQLINTLDPVHIQITKQLVHFHHDYNLEAVIAMMEAVACTNNTYSYLFIDAINESNNRNIWREGIITLDHLLKNYPHVKLVVSVRKGFEKECLGDYSDRNDTPSNGIIHLNHNGFEDLKNVYDFLSQEQNIISPELYLRNEMYNPLFLTWFCQAFSKDKTKNFASLIETILEIADVEASNKCDSIEPYEIIQELLFEFINIKKSNSINSVTKQDILSLKIWGKYNVKNYLNYIKSLETSGVLCTYKFENQKMYYIGYNLLEEYLHAKLIISSNEKQQSLYIASELLKNPCYENISVFCMFTSLYALEYNEECIEIIDAVNTLDDNKKSEIIDKYFEALAVRDADIPFEKFKILLRKYGTFQPPIWLPFIANSTKINRSLNAKGLNKILINLKLNDRDYLWTTYINEFTQDDRIVNVINYIVKGNIFSEIKTEQIELLMILFTWLLSSSNRILRDKTSKAMVEVLKNHFPICSKLLDNFKDVNDPYILQRLYGIIFGAVVKRNNCDKEIFLSLVLYVFNEIFNKDTVYPDILVRDYARLIIERYEYEFPGELNAEILKKSKPPYKSVRIPKSPPIKKNTSYIKGISDIFSSMQPDINGYSYGDFGRYVFQNSLEEFYNVDVVNLYNYAIHFIFNELKYSEKQFGSYDSSIARVKHQGRWVERIGKKYQWIALYNILARISDFYEITDYCCDTQSHPYAGVWELSVRDFDPTINIENNFATNLTQFTSNNVFELPSVDYNLDDVQAQKWVKDCSSIDDYIPLCLTREDTDKRQWISLHFSRNNVSKSDGSNNYYLPQKGTQYTEIFSTAYLIPKQGSMTIDKIKSERYFERHHISIKRCYSLFNREYSWSPGYDLQFNNPRVTDIDPNGIIPACINYLWEAHFDASQETSTSFLIPHGVIINELHLRQNDLDGIYYFGKELVAFDLRIFNSNNTSELLIRKDFLDKFLENGNYDIVWDISIDKRYHFDTNNCNYFDSKRIGIYKNGSIKIESITREI